MECSRRRRRCGCTGRVVSRGACGVSFFLSVDVMQRWQCRVWPGRVDMNWMQVGLVAGVVQAGGSKLRRHLTQLWNILNGFADGQFLSYLGNLLHSGSVRSWNCRMETSPVELLPTAVHGRNGSVEPTTVIISTDRSRGSPNVLQSPPASPNVPQSTSTIPLAPRLQPFLIFTCLQNIQCHILPQFCAIFPVAT